MKWGTGEGKLHMKRWDVLLSLIEETNATKIVELGVAGGRTMGRILQYKPDITYIGIDLWQEMPGREEEYTPGENGLEWNHEAHLEHVAKLSEAYAKASYLRLDTLVAAEIFKDGIFDIVFIDADHSYDGVKNDIQAWISKVNPNGIICGHDFSDRFPGVTDAVKECFSTFTLREDTVWAARPQDFQEPLVNG